MKLTFLYTKSDEFRGDVGEMYVECDCNHLYNYYTTVSSALFIFSNF